MALFKEPIEIKKILYNIPPILLLCGYKKILESEYTCKNDIYIIIMLVPHETI